MSANRNKKISEPHLLGYARISTLDQNPQMQIDALLAAGVAKEDIYHEKASSRTNRRQFEAMLEDAREGDIIVIWKLDRLGRTVRQVLETFVNLSERGVAVRVITQPGIDTTTAMGQLISTIMAAVADMERDFIRERIQAGLEAARRQGRVGGSKPQVTDAQVRSAALRIAHGENGVAVAKELGVTRQTIYKRMAQLRERNNAE